MVKKEKDRKGKYNRKVNSSTRQLDLIYSLISSAWHALFYKKGLVFVLPWSSLSKTSAFNFYLATQLVLSFNYAILTTPKINQEQEEKASFFTFSNVS